MTAPPVLLVDEVDRADDEFEAFLLEILSDYTITVPELGTFRAEVPPIVVVTSNRTRDVHDALKRRCLYHWIAHPDFERELAILRVARAGGSRAARPPGRGRGRGAARARALQAARRRRDDRLGGGARRARRDRDRRARGRRHARHRSSSTARTRSAPAPTVCESWSTRRWSAVPDDRPVARESTGSRSASRGLLRGAGLDVPVGATIAFAEALGAVGVDRRDGVYWAGRATLVRRPEDVDTYDRAFGAWWEGEHRLDFSPRRGRARARGRVRRRRGGRRRGRRRRRRTSTPSVAVRCSPAEVLRHRDFARYTPAEFAEARRLMADLRLAGALRRSRRRRTAVGTGGGPTCAARCAARCAPVASRSTARSSSRPSGRAGSCCCAT